MDSYCGRCGRLAAEAVHADCARLLQLEPPRYCAACGRRMKVQVSPMGWSATCVEHGELTAEQARPTGQTSKVPPLRQ